MQRELDALAERGGSLLDDRQYAAAEVQFERGFALAQQARSPASMAWFVAHRGFARVGLQNWLYAIQDLTHAILLGQLGNPYVHLMRGVALYEEGIDLPEAKNELFKACVLSGYDVFTEVDPKYWAFAIKGMKLPAGCSDWTTWTGAEPGSEMHRVMCDPRNYRFNAPPPN